MLFSSTAIRLTYELVPVALDGVKIVISNTNSPHKLDSGKYNERVAECQAAVKAIQPFKAISALGEISLDEFKKVENKDRKRDCPAPCKACGE